MCGTCGCGKPGAPAPEHEHVLPDGTVVRHAHGDGKAGDAPHAHDQLGEAHEHRLADGSVVRHRHDQAHGGHGHPEAVHEHRLADGTRVAHSHAAGATAHGHASDEHEHEHHLPDGSVVRHRHDHATGAAHPHAAPADEVETRRVRVELDLLSSNDRQAAVNRKRFRDAHTTTLNLMSSPGSGKTTLLVRTLEALRASTPLAVIEGDQQTDLDARRIEATGVKALQLNTGKGCHLDAAMVARALERLPPPAGGVLFIENVGNLVCPAAFDLGEAKKVVIVSVTEGEDKPLKYPDMFAVADLVLVNKVDLVPHLGFDLALLEGNVRRVKDVPLLRVSARTGEGLDAWLGWLAEARASA